jgi:hypothetical protein
MKPKTRLRRGSLDSAGSLSNLETVEHEDSVEVKEDTWMELAYAEHKEQRAIEVAELDKKKKLARKQALQLSKATTQIREATSAVGGLAQLAMEALHDEFASRDTTLEELASELLENEREAREAGDMDVIAPSGDREGEGGGGDGQHYHPLTSSQSSSPTLIKTIATMSKVVRKVTARKQVLERQVRIRFYSLPSFFPSFLTDY